MFKEFDVALPNIVSGDYIITDYGAVSGGSVSNTKAFARAIEAAALRGGRVVVPDGVWLTGPVELLSGVELHLSDNAVIVFDKNEEEYPLIMTDYEGIRRIRAKSPLYATDACDIAITGSGVIDGSGHLWRPVKEFKMTKRQWKGLLEKSSFVIQSSEGGIWMPTESVYNGRMHGEVFPGNTTEQDEVALKEAEPFYDFYRPVMISLKNCQRVLIEGVKLKNSPAWCVHPHFCKDVTIKGVNINNPYYAQNGDGIDIESCNRVNISHCYICAGDDGICLKAGKDREARAIPGPCENVRVSNCYVGDGHGGFVIGSEMSRGVSNILVEDCTFVNTDVGMRFKSAMGRGGLVEDIYIRRINMVNLKEEAIVMTMDYVHNNMDYHDAVVVSDDEEDVPEFAKVYIEECICTGSTVPLRIEGMQERFNTIHDIYLKDCKLSGSKDMVLKNCHSIYVDDENVSQNGG